MIGTFHYFVPISLGAIFRPNCRVQMTQPSTSGIFHHLRHMQSGGPRHDHQKREIAGASGKQCSGKQWRQPRQHFIHQRHRQSLQLAPVSGVNIQHSRLITPHNALGFDTADGHCKTIAFGKLSHCGDGANNRKSCGLVKGSGRNNQHGSTTLLLAA